MLPCKCRKSEGRQALQKRRKRTCPSLLVSTRSIFLPFSIDLHDMEEKILMGDETHSMLLIAVAMGEISYSEAWSHTQLGENQSIDVPTKESISIVRTMNTCAKTQRKCNSIQ